MLQTRKGLEWSRAKQAATSWPLVGLNCWSILDARLDSCILLLEEAGTTTKERSLESIVKFAPPPQFKLSNLGLSQVKVKLPLACKAQRARSSYGGCKEEGRKEGGEVLELRKPDARVMNRGSNEMNELWCWLNLSETGSSLLKLKVSKLATHRINRVVV